MYSWCAFKLPQAIELHAEGASLMLFKTSPSSLTVLWTTFMHFTHVENLDCEKNSPSFLCRHVCFTYWNVLMDGVPVLRGIFKLNHYTSRVINAVDFTFVSVFTKVKTINCPYDSNWNIVYLSAISIRTPKHCGWFSIVRSTKFNWQLNEGVHFLSSFSLSVSWNFYHQAKKYFILGPQQKHSHRNEQ